MLLSLSASVVCIKVVFCGPVLKRSPRHVMCGRTPLLNERTILSRLAEFGLVTIPIKQI